MDDVIVGISTSLGVGSVSIIRVSGKESILLVNKIFKEKDLTKVKSHTILYGHISYKSEIIDEVLVSVMLAPKTYTTEDVVEINCHGGINTTNKIVEILLSLGGRLAEPGEFTKRAFINGRIDLIEAESVNDLIFAKTDASRKMALNNINGKLTEKIKNIRQDLVNIIANIEVNIDYPEYEDIQEVTNNNLIPKLNEVKLKMHKLLESANNGRIINNGLNVAIIGKPNVGKSSILNSIIDEDKAIVTDIAGTTRDIVEGSISLNGVGINFIDTAGIRETEDIVEKIGVDKSLQISSRSDLVIIVLNNNEEISKEELNIIESIPEEKRIIFINKCDLDKKLIVEYNVIYGDTLSIDGLNDLKQAIVDKFQLSNMMNGDLSYISNVRQLNLIKKSLEDIEKAIESLSKGISVDMAQIDIRSSWEHLGEIIGATYQDELIDTLFSNFCLGK